MTEELEVIDHTTRELSKFDQIEVAIANIKAEAEAITVIDHTDKHNATKARNLRLTIKPTRIQADNLRKEIKAPFLKLCDVIEKKGQSIIKPLDAIERELKAKEEIVSKHAEREAEKERARIAAEQEAARKQLEADQAKLAADRAEVERQRAEIEKEKADAEAKRQHEADIAAAVELGRQRAIREREQVLAQPGGNQDYSKPLATMALDELPANAQTDDRQRLEAFAAYLVNINVPVLAGRQARTIAYDAIDMIKSIAETIRMQSRNL